MKEEINKILNQALSGEHQAAKDYSDWTAQAESLSESKTAKLFQEIGHDEEHHVAELTQEIREMVDRAEDMAIQDVIIGSAIGEGGIPIHGRENRKEPCRCCKTDNKLMCSSSDVIGLLSQKEIKEWCSEIIEVPDGRCERARKIKEAAKECKEKHPHNTAGFWECYAPAFSKITRGSNPGVTPVSPEVSLDEALRAFEKSFKYGVDITKITEDEYVKAGLAYYKKEIKELGFPLDLKKQAQILRDEYKAIPKAEAGMSEEQRKELLERGIVV